MSSHSDCLSIFVSRSQYGFVLYAPNLDAIYIKNYIQMKIKKIILVIVPTLSEKEKLLFLWVNNILLPNLN